MYFRVLCGGIETSYITTMVISIHHTKIRFAIINNNK